MPDSPAKKQWLKDNAVIVTFRLFKKGDADILDFYGGKPTATDIRVALREHMQIEEIMRMQEEEEEQ